MTYMTCHIYIYKDARQIRHIYVLHIYYIYVTYDIYVIHTHMCHIYDIPYKTVYGKAKQEEQKNSKRRWYM